MGQITITVPTGVDPKRADQVARRAVARLATVSDVEKTLAGADALPGPGSMAQAVLREERWRGIDSKWGLLSGPEVAALVGKPGASHRTVTANLRRRKALAAVKRNGALRYPGFQFTPGSEGTLVVAPSWTQLRGLLAPLKWNDEDTILWAAAPNAWLAGRSPAEEIFDHPGSVSQALGGAVAVVLESLTAAAFGSLGSATRVTDLLSVSQSQISRWRSGKERPSPAKVRELIDLDHIVARARLLWNEAVVDAWLTGPNAYLDGARPIDVLRTRGASEVLDALDDAQQGAMG